ncbi:hypothetical protein GOV14_06100 [Candidatus Pacearchaeota archaeon]|nr:hypothetical protein [Candidatus Pacearchaeota archaeon]
MARKKVVKKATKKSAPPKRLRSDKHFIAKLLRLVVWITGVLVSLAVGSGMIKGILYIPYIHATVTWLAGWAVILLTLSGVILAILHRL